MKLEGVYVPMVTPFDKNGQVEVEKVKMLAKSFIDQGAAGLVVCGTTGESYALSDDERTLILSTVVKVAKGQVQLIAGVNALSTDQTISYANEAKSLGYDGLMLSANPYSLPSQEGIIAHFEKVANAVKMPIIMYNFPARVGINIEFETVAHLAKNPYIVGIKESSGNFSQALRLLQAKFDDFEIVCGCDDQPVDFLFWGAKSWIAGAANVFCEEQVAIVKMGLEGDWESAKQIMTQIYPAIYSMESGGYNQKAKAGCLKGQIDVGDVRVPLVPMNGEEKAAFLSLLK